MTLPEGCNKCFQVSFIEDEYMRPSPEACWLVDAKNGDIALVTCTMSLEEAIAQGQGFIE